MDMGFDVKAIGDTYIRAKNVKNHDPYYTLPGYIMIIIINIVYTAVIALLKRNFGRLCNCLPQDYSKSLDKLKVIMNMPDHICQQIHDHQEHNQLIIYVLMSKITSTSVPTFLNTLEKLVDDEASKCTILTLKQGKEMCKYNNVIEN